MHCVRHCFALALATGCLPAAEPDLWTYEVDVSDREDIITFDVIEVGDDLVWRIEGAASDRESRLGRIGAEGDAIWTRDLGDDIALGGLAAAGAGMVGLVYDRDPGEYVLRGFDGEGAQTWSRPWDEAAWGRPEELVGDHESIYVGTTLGVIACSTSGEGCRVHYELPAGRGVYELLPFGDGRLVVHTIDLDTFVAIALDAEGRELARYDSEGDLVWDVAAGGDVVYVHHGSAEITRLDLVSGDARTFFAPEPTFAIGATPDGDLIALELGDWDELSRWDEDQISAYSSDLDPLWRAPVPMGGDNVRARDDGTVLAWTSAYQFPELWITVVDPREE